MALLVVAGCLIACSPSKDIVDDVTDELEVDLSNIESLYAKSLPVIQKCLEGNWTLLYSVGGIMGETIVDKYDSYMKISRERVIFGNKNEGVVTDSPVIWANLENFYENIDARILAYNFRDEAKSIMYADLLFPSHIKNDTLVVWNLNSDGYIMHYTRTLVSQF